MPSFTPYFSLAYFNVGDDLSDASNVTDEMDRFMIIDSQLYGLYSIFGSGVINGWQVVLPESPDPTDLAVEIQPGLGIVNLMAAETTFNDTVDQLPPNQVSYIFAQTTGLTTVDRDVNFFAGRTQFATNAILLAAVVTSSNSVVSIDTTVARQIGFQSVIAQAIATHHHRGSPTKIDLPTETKGQLSGNQIGDLSASLITTGKFTVPRLPLIDHASLANIGSFTHVEIDAMLRKIVNSTGEQRLIELAIANKLKQDTFLKYKFDESDQYLLNELVFIPGISPETWIDWDATTANVNLATNCISGHEAQEGQTISVLWNTDNSFDGATTQTNVVIGSNGVTLLRGDINTQLVEGFEAVPTGGVLTNFTASVVAADDETGVTGDPIIKVQGNQSGKFVVDQTNQGTFTKNIGGQDWSQWDNLTVDVKCTTATHGAVYMYLVDSSGIKSSICQILAINEVTTNPDPLMYGFEQRTLLLSSWPNRVSVSELVVLVDDVDHDYGFWLDNIVLHQAQDYVSQGDIRFRYGTNEPVVFNSLVYDTTLPVGTVVNARIRVADSEDDLDNSLFSPFIQSSDSFAMSGLWAEIDIQLFSDYTQTYTPTLIGVELAFTANAESNGFTIDSAAQWEQGTWSNLAFIDDENVAQISTPLTVGDYVFINQGQVNELSETKTPVFGMGNKNVPMSEWQAFAALTDASVQPGLSNPSSVVRTEDSRYIVSDTDNHRILIFNQSGGLLNAYCGANDDADSGNNAIVGLTATYNQSTSTLWLGFSKQITLTTDSFNSVYLNVGSQQVVLAAEGLALTGTAGTITGRVLPLVLTEETQSILNGTLLNCFISYGPAFSSDLNTLFVNTPIQVYFAPVAYYDYIYYPVYAVESKQNVGRFWVCNATKLPIPSTNVEPVTPATRNLQEFDPTQDSGIYTNSIYFMLEYGGMVYEDDIGNLFVAGVDFSRKGHIYQIALGTVVTGSSSSVNLNLNTPATVYTSPDYNYPNSIDFDSTGLLWAAESSSIATGGRVLQMDLYGNLTVAIGDVFTVINSIQCLDDGTLLIGT